MELAKTKVCGKEREEELIMMYSEYLSKNNISIESFEEDCDWKKLHGCIRRKVWNRALFMMSDKDAKYKLILRRKYRNKKAKELWLIRKYSKLAA